MIVNKDFIVLIVFDVIAKDRKITLINTYIRSDLGDPESHSNYLESLFNLENILEDHDSQNILLVGDFNADPLHGRAWHNLNDFMTRNSMRCYDYQGLPVDSFSYVSFSDSHIRWLDHLIGKLDADLVIDNVEILYDLIGSDHLPLKFSIDLPVNFCSNPLNIQPIESRDYVDWNALSGDELQFISEQSFYLQGDFGNHTINSCNYNCENKECLEYLDRMYESIVESVHISSLKFSKNHTMKNKFKVVPGWNRRVKSFYNEARNSYKQWLCSGKMRTGDLFERMKVTRSEFKKALKKCRHDESNEIRQHIMVTNHFLHKL